MDLDSYGPGKPCAPTAPVELWPYILMALDSYGPGEPCTPTALPQPTMASTVP